MKLLSNKPERHDYEPGDPDRMSTDPRCRICGEPKRKHK